jgi:high-affinity iron transporter
VDSVLNTTTAVPSTVGINGSAPAASEPPVAASVFQAPIAAYRRFADRQLRRMSGDVAGLRRALAAGTRLSAQSAWRRASIDYLALGAVYLDPGPAARLDQRIDGDPDGLLGGAASPRFSGLHRLERGLWTGQPVAQLMPWAQRLSGDVARLRRVLPAVPIAPQDYVARAHEILEDAVRDLLSGTDVPWSGEGVLGTEAGVIATTEIVRTLAPILRSRDGNGLITTVDTDVAGVRSTVAAIRRAHHGQLPTDGELTRQESERLDGSVGQALEGLAQIPGALETSPNTAVPSISTGQNR